MSPIKKPAGGITAAGIVPVDGSPQPEIRLVEDRSSYTEDILSDDGILRVRHTLTLVVPRETAAAMLPLAAGMVSEGVTALVTTAAGEQLTVGWSERFRSEQPLRLQFLSLGTGTRPADGNAATLRFESEDTTALLEI